MKPGGLNPDAAPFTSGRASQAPGELAMRQITFVSNFTVPKNLSGQVCKTNILKIGLIRSKLIVLHQIQRIISL